MPVFILYSLGLCTYTVFIRIVAVATINFSLTGVRLLIEGGSYSRVAFINFGVIPHSAIHKHSDWFMRTALQIIEIWSKNKQPYCCRAKPRCLLPCFCLKLTIIQHLRSWAHPLKCVHACVQLLFLSQSSRCGYYSRVATIQGVASI